MTRARNLVLRLAAPCAVSVVASLGCTTTLDPVVVPEGSDGGAGNGGVSLAECRAFTFAQSEYLLCTERLAFSAAAHDCALRAASLVAVTSAEEEEFLLTLVDGVAGDKWLGGSRDDELVWSWPDGTIFWRGASDGMAEDGAFVVWHSGEPNDASTTSPDPERCLALTPGDAWNDRACELALPYVCERAAAAP